VKWEDALLFNLEFDHGDVLEGYLIPDGFSDQPAIRVLGEEGDLLRMQCAEPRPAVVQSGRHETGLVGFRLDDTVLPGLASRRLLEIRDARSGILIYRRPGARHHVPLKVFRMEFQMLPLLKLDHHCGKHFQYELTGMERFGQETALQAFHLNAVDSIYLSGRLHLRNFEEFFDKGFQVVGYLPDPYYEMASRIALLKRLSQTQITILGERDRLALASAAAHFAEVVLDDERSLKKALQTAGPRLRDVFVSPATRQLVRFTSDQPVSRRDVASAIDLLSRFAVVGQDGAPMHFENAIAELLDLPLEDIPSVSRHSILDAIAARLRRLPIVEGLLETDLILHHYVREAAASHAFSAE
jgi:hypothetical protein